VSIGGQAARGRILVIDDEHLIRWSLAEVLQGEGYAVTALDSPREVLLQAEAADLVLLDWRLPGSDGLAVATLLRRARPQLPIILMTASGTPGLLEEAAAVGVWRVLAKPFDEGHVLALVRSALASGSSADPAER
jgi:CheY-like chemotaxis protein